MKQICKCGKKPGRLKASQGKNVEVTIEKECQIIQSLVELRIANKSDVANVMTYQKIRHIG